MFLNRVTGLLSSSGISVAAFLKGYTLIGGLSATASLILSCVLILQEIENLRLKQLDRMRRELETKKYMDENGGSFSEN